MTGCQTPKPSSHSTVIQLEAGRPANLPVMALALQPVGQESDVNRIEPIGCSGAVAVPAAVILPPAVVVVLVLVVVPAPTTWLICSRSCVGKTVVCSVTPSVFGSVNGELAPHTLPIATLILFAFILVVEFVAVVLLIVVVLLALFDELITAVGGL